MSDVDRLTREDQQFPAKSIGICATCRFAFKHRVLEENGPMMAPSDTSESWKGPPEREPHDYAICSHPMMQTTYSDSARGGKWIRSPVLACDGFQTKGPS